ncbi:hypothetical protein CY35_16G015500 [Sphagnum magellanicum]|nr:hypothetical protein CY35_16G015500 [Sphagnum magellanicum]
MEGSNEDGSDAIITGVHDQERKSKSGGIADPPSSISLKVAHGLFLHDVIVPVQASFGDVKSLLVQETGLEPQEQRLLFRGKEKEDAELLSNAGVKDKSKLLLVEDSAAHERRIHEQQEQEQITRACQAISVIRANVDKLSEQVSACEATAKEGGGCPDKDLLSLSELLMQTLLKLDAIKAEGEAKNSRRTEVKRVQGLVDTIDRLRGENTNPPSVENEVIVTTQWETFDSDVGSNSGCRIRFLTNKNPEEISGVPGKDQCQTSDLAAPSSPKMNLASESKMW